MRVQRRRTAPEFNRVVYNADSPQALYLREVCSESGSWAIGLGVRIFKKALAVLQLAEVEPKDPRGLIVGFHTKVLDDLAGARALAREGALGLMMVATRVIFESYLLQSHIVAGDGDKLAAEYRLLGRLEGIKDLSARAPAAGSHSFEAAELTELQAAGSEFSVDISKLKGGWNIPQLAEHLQLAGTYAGVYRQTSAVIHARDADLYNPIVISVMRQREAVTQPLEQPYFMSSCGCWGATDVLAMAALLEALPICVFGNTADFLGLELEQADREVISLQRRAIRSGRDHTTMADLRKSFEHLLG